jgi:microsomal dipeptidase-like Zn-dependent dipeptidase
MVILTQLPVNAGIDEEGIAKVMGGNILRLLSQVLPTR